MTVVVTAVFLFGSIIGFYLASGAVVKLIMIAVFTALFAASLGLITNARRAEIFGATAAYVLELWLPWPLSQDDSLTWFNSYAAVLVVFVSSGSLSPDYEPGNTHAFSSW